MRLKDYSPFTWSFLAACAALNLAVGFLVQALKLPIYLDSIGTVLAAATVGLFGAVAVGLVGTVLLTLVTAPTTLAYAVTSIVIATFAAAATKFGYLQRLTPTLVLGVLLGVVSALISAPITVYLFGGISFAGADAMTAFFAATGQTIAKSVLFGGLATDPIDKLAASVLAFLFLRNMPRKLRSRLEVAGSNE